MPIIIDNFHVNVPLPIDNRFVVGSSSFYSTKEDITFKYLGLRVWDLNDNIPYYWAGTVSGWLSENSVGVLADTNSLSAGESGYITKFTSGPNVVGKSLIYENQATKQLGIGLTGININANHSSTPIQNSLHVAGNVKTNNYFVGNGAYITNLNVSNVSSGLLDIRYISNLQSSISGSVITPTNNYVLFNNGVNVTWTNTNTISVLNATNTTNVNVIDETSSTISHYITFAQSTGNLPIKISSSKIQFIPSNGQLLLSNGSVTNPIYSFLNSTNTGMYFDGYNINFSNNGINTVSIRPGGITIRDINYAQIDFYKSPTDIQKLFVGQGNILKYRTNAWDSDGTIQIASDNIVWHSSNLYTLKSSGIQLTENGRDTNSQSLNADGSIVKGIYTYNVYNSNITPSTQVHWSVISFGKGDEGSVQLASNWYGNNIQNGLVYADRDILLRSLRDTTDSWSPWVKIWNSGNSGYVPFGAIMMWSGSVNQIPTGWRLCDGSAPVSIPIGSVPGHPSITSITIPDLRERFVVGAGIESNKLIFNYDTNFTLYIPTANTPGTYTFIVDTTTPYYIDSTGKLKSGVNTDGFRYHLYRGTNTSPGMSGFLYIIYDNRFASYEVIQGAFPALNATVSGTVKWMGNGKGGTSFFSIDPLRPLNNDTTLKYNKHFSNGRRVAFTEIVWPTIQSTGYTTGDKGGFDSIVLEGSQMVKHQHDSLGENFGNYLFGATGAQNKQGAADVYNLHYLTSAYGNNQPIENRPPYYALAFIIYIGI